MGRCTPEALGHGGEDIRGAHARLAEAAHVEVTHRGNLRRAAGEEHRVGVLRLGMAGEQALGALVQLVELPRAGEEPEEESPSFAATVEEPKKERTPQWDQAELLRRTFALDVLACARCGGRLRGCWRT